MSGRPVVNTSGYTSPLSGPLARMPGDDGGLNMATVKRESVAVDPLAVLSSQPICEQQNDAPNAVNMMVNNFLSLCRCAPMDLSKVPHSLNGLHELAHANAWKQVLEMSDSLITSKEFEQELKLSGTAVTPAIGIRMEAMFRLKLFDDLAQEAGIILAERERQVNLQSTGEMSDHNAIIAIKILLAEVKTMTGRGNEAIGQLHVIQNSLLPFSSKGDVGSRLQARRWLLHVQCAIVNAHMRQRQWRLAVASLVAILKDVRKSDDGPAIAAPDDVEIVLKCLLARALLQVGAMEASEGFSEAAWRQFLSTKATAVDAQGRWIDADARASQGPLGDIVWQHVHLSRGVILFAKCQYEAASGIFNSIIENHRSLPTDSHGVAFWRASVSLVAAEVSSTHVPSAPPLSSIAVATAFNADRSSEACLPMAAAEVAPDALLTAALVFNGPPPGEHTTESGDSGGVGGEATTPVPVPVPVAAEAGVEAEVAEPVTSGGTEGLASVLIPHPFLLADLQTEVLAVAVNNLSVCGLFLKRIDAAVGNLERLIQEDPSRYMVDPVVFNLCTLYDLTCSPDTSANKKKVLQRVAAIYNVSDAVLQWVSFRFS